MHYDKTDSSDILPVIHTAAGHFLTRLNNIPMNQTAESEKEVNVATVIYWVSK